MLLDLDRPRGNWRLGFEFGGFALAEEALELGRREIQINVLRLGWNPKASTPTLVERLFRQREAALETQQPLPSRPIELR